VGSLFKARKRTVKSPDFVRSQETSESVTTATTGQVRLGAAPVRHASSVTYILDQR